MPRAPTRQSRRQRRCARALHAAYPAVAVRAPKDIKSISEVVSRPSRKATDNGARSCSPRRTGVPAHHGAPNGSAHSPVGPGPSSLVQRHRTRSSLRGYLLTRLVVRSIATGERPYWHAVIPLNDSPDTWAVLTEGPPSRGRPIGSSRIDRNRPTRGPGGSPERMDQPPRPRGGTKPSVGSHDFLSGGPMGHLRRVRPATALPSIFLSREEPTPFW